MRGMHSSDLVEDAEQALKHLQNELRPLHAEARTYTTVVVFGGYAGLFAIWNFVREIIPGQLAFAVALLGVISLITFVCFGIFAMLFRQNQVTKVAELINSGLDPEHFLVACKELNDSSFSYLFRLFWPIWKITTVISVLTGISAGLILIYVSFRGAVWGL